MDWTLTTKWIWAPNYSEDLTDSSSIAKVVYFRKKFTLAADTPEIPVIANISADTRYTLFVNGQKVCFGPARSYLQKWNYESPDISHLLHAGENVIAVQVLRYSIKEVGPVNMIKANIPGFIFNCKALGIVSDESWKTFIDDSIGIKSTSAFPQGGPFLPVYQTIDASRSPLAWKSITFDDSDWSNAKLVQILFPTLPPWRLSKREIPMLTHQKKHFKTICKVSGDLSLQSLSLSSTYDSLLQGGEVTFPAASKIVVHIDNGELTTGFPSLSFLGGAGATVDILYSEGYEQPPAESSGFGQPRFKGDRTDTSGVLLGGVDNYTVCGSGEETFEPLWMRTFRYVELTITTSTTPLTLKDFHYYETHYPLDDISSVSLPGELQKYWDISRHTLKNCMHETYEDCPYYEQSQFIMDTRAQMLFTYQVSRDDRLARKTIQEFFASLRGDGFMETFYPGFSSLKNIPTFSLFWILMIYDHMLYFGDEKLVKRYFGAVDIILSAFEDKINDFGMVGRFDSSAWAYVDWVKEWSKFPTIAFPPVYMKNGTIAFHSLLYSYVLQRASEIAKFIGRHDTATEYTSRAEMLNTNVNKHCYIDNIYTDGPDTTDICQHTQVMAVLAGAVSGANASALLEKSFVDTPPSMAKCSYAMSFYVCRAFEEAGIYDRHFDLLMKPYKEMCEMNVTTWIEDDVNQRSDCHGWGACPLYEFPACLFGLRPSLDGGLLFDPKKMVDGARARIVTKLGVVEVEVVDGEYFLTTSEEGVIINVKQNGKKIELVKDMRVSIVIQ